MNDEKIAMLFNKDNNLAYQTLKELLVVSDTSNEVYSYMDTFFTMLDHDNSYVRNRGIYLIAANAKWDVDNIIDNNIQAYLAHMEDDKPITSRQCIKEVVKIARSKPHLIEVIIKALEIATVIYDTSMQSLINKDRKKALQQVKQYIEF